MSANDIRRLIACTSGLIRQFSASAWLTITALMMSTSVHALQVINAVDGVSVEAILSIKEPTRIRIESASITDVFGNIYSSHCGNTAVLPAVLPTAIASPDMGGQSVTPINPAGDVIIECDRDKGEIYLRPIGNSSKPVNLFISCAHATYTLLLHRSDTPADTILIRDKTLKASNKLSSAQTQSGPSPNHVRAMKTMLASMMTENPPADIRTEEINRPIQLWAQARFLLLRQFEGRGLIGEKYQLQNISNLPMVLAEQEFDRENGHVVGVAIEQHNLLPGASTKVYIIRSRGMQ